MRSKVSIWFLTVIFCLFLCSNSFPGEGENFKPKLSIKLLGGLSYVKYGDINLSLGSVNNNEVFEYWREHDPERVVGKIKRLNNWINDWEAELRIDITSKIGIGIATSGPIHRKNESSLTYTYKGSAGDQITAFTIRPEVKVLMPVKLNIYYAVPFNPKARIIFNAGIAYYSAKASQYRKYELTPPVGESEWIKRNWDTNPKYFFGFHLGYGVEYSLSRNLAFVVEAQGRYARINDFEGSMQLEHIYAGIYGEHVGTLYYFNFWDAAIGAGYTDVEVLEVSPDVIYLFKYPIRKAVLDLSGLSLRIGIRIRLF